MGCCSLFALQVALSSNHISVSSIETARRCCSAFRSAPLPPSSVSQSAWKRCRLAGQAAVSAAYAGQSPLSSDAVVGLGRGGGGQQWRRLANALHQRQPEAAWKEFLALLEDGVLAPAQLCDDLISALCGDQRFREAWHAYAATSSAGYCLQYNTYQALITQALKAGRLDAALDTFRDMQAAGRAANVVTYCGLIAALGRERRRRGVRYAQTAHDLWGELLSSGMQLDAAAYRTGIKACVDVGRLRDADRLLSRMAEAGVPPDVRAYNILLAGHSRAGNTGAMRRLLHRMTAAGVQPSSVTYNTLIDGHVRARDVAGARRMVQQAAAAQVPLDVWTYSTLIKGYVQAGQLAEAEAVLADMAAARVKPSCVTFTTLISGHVSAGDMQAAERMLHSMLASGTAPNALTYNALLRGYAAQAAAAAGGAPTNGGTSKEAPAGRQAPPAANSSLLGAALALLRDMQDRGVAPSVETFNTLMSAAAAAGDCHLALDLHARLHRAGLRPDALTYTNLIQVYGRLGQVAEAATAFESLLRDRSAAPDLRAYNALVDALARNGDMAAAERMLDATAELADKQGLPPPVEAFGAVVAGYARQVAVGPAVAAVKRFHALGGSPDAQMLDILANIAIRAGDYKVAMQAVRALELIGREVDKAKYAAQLQEARGRLGGQQQAADRPRHNRSWAAYQRRKEARRKNVQLERFKFWLGLPNNYYDSDLEQLDSSDLD